VAEGKPLALRVARAKKPQHTANSALKVAALWVDSGVFHLDQSFDYLIPEALKDLISIGTRVIVPFNSRLVEGLVIELREESKEPRLKYISKVLGIPVATESSLQLIRSVAERWASHPMDVVRFAIPPRVAKAEKLFPTEVLMRRTEKRNESHPEYLQLPPHKNRYQLIAHLVQKKLSAGAVLIVMPEVRDILHLRNQLEALGIHSIALDAGLPRDERYASFLSGMYGGVQVVVGTRSAIFAPIANLSGIIIFNELSDAFYEQRSPGWNVRDVALLRNELEEVSLSFVGYSPSLELASDIDRSKISFTPVRAKIAVETVSAPYGELLPGKCIVSIRRALPKGPVLFIAPQKGYALAIACAKCRNVARCDCGGKLQQLSARSAISCAHCELIYPEWKCTWCQSQVPYLQSRGALRYAHEIGIAFPQQKIVESTAEKKMDIHGDREGIIVATPGAIPFQPGGYSAVVLLNADYFLNQSDLRAIERVRETLFSSAALLTPEAPFVFIGEDTAGITSALRTWKPQIAISRELTERSDVALPPFSRAATMDIASSEASSLFRALTQAKENGLMPESTLLSGPTELRDDISRILIRADVADGDAMIKTLHEFQRRRSLSKKVLALLRIDPYSLSR
jgi:primosomal protein N' (replication factor Y)